MSFPPLPSLLLQFSHFYLIIDTIIYFITATGIPIKLLHEGEGHIVTVELKNGEIYRGMLLEAEDTMNCQLKEVTFTAKDGRISKLENVFLRGGHIKFIVLPDILKNAPMFSVVQKLSQKKQAENAALGRGIMGGRGRGGGRGGRGGGGRGSAKA